VDFIQAEKLATEAGRKMGELPVQLILADGSEHPDAGKWVFIDRLVDATTATIRARAEFPNPRKVLRPGMFARVRVSLPVEERNILVPERALTELQGKNFLWVVSADNKASQRAVEVAPNRMGSEAVIVKGLEPGERVVVEGVQKLREGAPVQPKSADEVAKTVAALVPPAAAADARQGEAKPAKH
jgi:membrane fusion protein (multidrug efflux system)